MKLGIVGYPLGHTLSPLLHHTLLQQAGLAGEYAVYETQLLANTLNQLMAHEVRGVNVTIPYKVDVLAYCATVSQRAGLLQAVNTLVRKGDAWHGENTDATGYWASLPQPIQASVSQRHVCVLGAGGAARAVVATLIEHEADTITLMARQTEKATELAELAREWCRVFGSRSRIRVQVWDTAPDLRQVDMLINTTPVGMAGKTPDALPLERDSLYTLPPDAFVSDLIYRPLETGLVAEARAAGVEAQGGLGMLVHQGVEAFTLWTGHSVTSVECERLTLVLSQAVNG
jgi:shikimate dehydrogenase